ncbi:hypothetical protein GUJ93_ZPchr0013g37608 [Zizania palustris]|uniref:Uncharacterized protein n=1 Tax=Zizania palustris TaxID=103762 RepID=A0A8J6C0E3_ZIZPA|nr:hypothetical protein GUJ93_ZPchr0013g37608 [Zizania palustris]
MPQSLCIPADAQGRAPRVLHQPLPSAVARRAVNKTADVSTLVAVRTHLQLVTQLLGRSKVKRGATDLRIGQLGSNVHRNDGGVDRLKIEQTRRGSNTQNLAGVAASSGAYPSQAALRLEPWRGGDRDAAPARPEPGGKVREVSFASLLCCLLAAFFRGVCSAGIASEAAAIDVVCLATGLALTSFLTFPFLLRAH